MKVFISADIEGIGGVALWDQARTSGPEHRRASEWMTAEVNAAIEGALEGGATEVVVRDAHGRAGNILWESLHGRAKLISGWSAKPDMMPNTVIAVWCIGSWSAPAIWANCRYVMPP